MARADEIEMYGKLKGELITLPGKGERGDAVFLAGRKAIPEEVVGSTMSEAPSGFSESAFLMSGAPGAGRTALAREAMRISRKT